MTSPRRAGYRSAIPASVRDPPGPHPHRIGEPVEHDVAHTRQRDGDAFALGGPVMRAGAQRRRTPEIRSHA
jgi:hypothetical protein